MGTGSANYMSMENKHQNTLPVLFIIILMEISREKTIFVIRYLCKIFKLLYVNNSFNEKYVF